MEEQFSNSQRVFHSPIHHEYVRQVFQLLFIQYKAIFLIWGPRFGQVLKVVSLLTLQFLAVSLTIHWKISFWFSG